MSLGKPGILLVFEWQSHWLYLGLFFVPLVLTQPVKLWEAVTNILNIK